MDRLERRIGFMCTRMSFGTRSPRLLARRVGISSAYARAMGHADHAVLHRNVRLTSERDLGPLSEWGKSDRQRRPELAVSRTTPR